jgi:8-oxo-dGTP pyrophosphatase MutT (NUDIX family)
MRKQKRKRKPKRKRKRKNNSSKETALREAKEETDISLEKEDKAFKNCNPPLMGGRTWRF